MIDGAWTRAFALTARLAGEDARASEPLDPDARESVARQMEALQSDDRAKAAQKLMAARVALMRRAVVSASEAQGAALLASWLRGLKAAERVAVVRALDGATASAVLARVTNTPPLKSSEAQTMTAVATLAIRCLGRAMRASEWSELIDALTGRGELASESVVRVERALRARGMRASAVILAQGVPT